MKHLALILAILIPTQAAAFGLDLPRLSFPVDTATDTATNTGPGAGRACTTPATPTTPGAPDCPAQGR